MTGRGPTPPGRSLSVGWSDVTGFGEAGLEAPLGQRDEIQRLAVCKPAPEAVVQEPAHGAARNPRASAAAEDTARRDS